MSRGRLVLALLAAALLAGCGSAPYGSADAPRVPPGPPGIWVPVADAPLQGRENPTLVWTGREVLVFGGSTDNPCPPMADCVIEPAPAPRDAAAYDLSTKAWRRVADTPEQLRFPAAVTVGRTVFALSRPWVREKQVFASYDAEADRWTELPAPPGAPFDLAVAGNHVVAFQSATSARRDEPDSVYDPARGYWSPLPVPPQGFGSDRRFVGVDDAHVVLLDVEPDPRPFGEQPPVYRAAVLALDHLADYADAETAWTRLPDSQIVNSEAVWLDVEGQLVNPTQGSSDGNGSWGRSYPTSGVLDLSGDPASWTVGAGTWQTLQPDPGAAAPGDIADDRGAAPPLTPAVSGKGLVISRGAVLDVATQAWDALPGNDRFDGLRGPGQVWAGDRLFLWGGVRFPGTTAGPGSGRRVLGAPGDWVLGGWTWRPASADEKAAARRVSVPPTTQPRETYVAPVLHVTCTDHGTVVTSSTVAAHKDGVHLLVTNRTGDDTTYLSYGPVTDPDSVEPQFAGGDPAPADTVERVLAIPPGGLDLHCSRPPGATDGPPVRVMVTDPAGYYRTVDAEQVLGCTFRHGIADGPYERGATPEAAAVALAETLGGDPTLTRDSGYPDQDGQRFLVDAGDVRAAISVEVRETDLLPDGTQSSVGDDFRWAATITATC